LQVLTLCIGDKVLAEATTIGVDIPSNAFHITTLHSR